MPEGDRDGFKRRVLHCVCRHPFSRVTDLAAWLYCPEHKARRALRSLFDDGLVGRTWHSAPLLPRSRRYLPQPEGLDVAAGETGTSVSNLARRYPVSVQRLRWISDRLDSIAHLYSIASSLSRADRLHQSDEDCHEQGAVPNVVEGPVARIALYTSGPYDAIVRLRGGGTVGVIRQDPARSRSSLVDDRLRPFFEEYSIRRGRRPPYMAGKLLVLVPTGWEARVVLSYLSDRLEDWVGPEIYVHTEHEAVVSDSVDVATSLLLDLRPSVSPLPVSERLIETIRVPTRRHIGQMLRSLPLTTSPKEREVLRVVADMPQISRRDLSIAVSEGREAALSDSSMSGLMSDLVEKHGVIRASGGRDSTTYVPERRGITYIANQGRLRAPEALARWGGNAESTDARQESAVTVTQQASTEVLNLLQQRYPNHTQGVYWLIARLKSGIESLSPHCEFKWFLPTHRSRRTWENTAIEPDGIMEFWYRPHGEPPLRVPMMVEYERSAVHPGRSRRRLGRYNRYFDSDMVFTDHDARPLIIFVFDTERAEKVFSRAASETGRALPIFTSNRELLSPVSADRFMLANAWWTLPLRSGRQPRHSLAGRIHRLRRQLLDWQ